MADRRLEITISGDASKFIGELKKAGVQAKAFDDDAQKAGKGTASFGDAMDLLGGPSLTLATAITAVGAGAKYATDAARESRARLAQLEAVLKSTGGAAGVTADELNDYASQLQRVTNFDDDAVTGAQSLLLTFTKVGSEVFPRATKAILDTSVAMKQDLQSSTIQIGKALNDPIAGLSALTRVGIQFTDQQKEQIKIMSESGDIAGAQTVILEELERQFGGSAEAARIADGGFIAVQNSLGNFAEVVGESLMPTMIGLNEVIVSGLDGWTMAYENMALLAEGSSILAERGQSLGTVWLDTLFNQEALAGAVQEVTAAQAEQATGLETNTEAIKANAEEVQRQAEILRDNQQTTADYYSNIFEMTDERVKSEQEANLKIAQSQSDASAAIAQNNQELNDRIAELGNERIEARNELAARGSEMSDAEYEAEQIKIDNHYNELVTKTREKYGEQNSEIQTKFNERQLAIEEQQRKEKEAYEAQLLDMKLKTSLGILERTGQLEEFTGIAGIKAEEALSLIKGGVLKVDGELLNGINGAYQSFNQNIGDAKRTAGENITGLKDVFSGTFTGITDSNNTMKDKLITNFREIETAARSAATVGNGLSITGSVSAANYATGGSFTVPPGYPNDSYMIGTSSGETVTVLNNMQYSPTYNGVNVSPQQDYQFMQMFNN